MEGSKEQARKNVTKNRNQRFSDTSAKIKVTIETESKTRIEKFNKHKKQTPSKKTVSPDIFKYIHYHNISK